MRYSIIHYILTARYLFLSLMVLMLFCYNGLSQSQIIITGRVTNIQTDEPVPFVSISIKGSGTGCLTDDKGYFEIAVSSKSSILVFTSIGYFTSEETVGGRTVVNIALKPKITELEKTVVTA